MRYDFKSSNIGEVSIYITGGNNDVKLALNNTFIPGVFGSMLDRIKFNHIVGNIYRHNSYHCANPKTSNKYLVNIWSHKRV